MNPYQHCATNSSKHLPLGTLTQLYSVLVPANEDIVTQNKNKADIIYLSVVSSVEHCRDYTENNSNNLVFYIAYLHIPT